MSPLVNDNPFFRQRLLNDFAAEFGPLGIDLSGKPIVDSDRNQDVDDDDLEEEEDEKAVAVSKSLNEQSWDDEGALFASFLFVSCILVGGGDDDNDKNE